jgi:hypothetical protein
MPGMRTNHDHRSAKHLISHQLYEEGGKGQNHSPDTPNHLRATGTTRTSQLLQAVPEELQESDHVLIPYEHRNAE